MQGSHVRLDAVCQHGIATFFQEFKGFTGDKIAYRDVTKKEISVIIDLIEDIREAISYGVIKMNIDTDTQWAFWDGVRRYYINNEGYLQAQIGNPEGEDKPNKKKYDPRVWLREGEKSMIARLKQAFDDLNALNRN